MDKIELLNQRGKGTMIEFLGIRFTAVGDDYLEATMPITERTCKIDTEKQDVRGLEINGNHLSAATGTVTARATLLHRGRRTHVSEIKIRNEKGKLVNVSRMTNFVIDK